MRGREPVPGLKAERDRGEVARSAELISVLLPTEEIGGHERMLIEWLGCAREWGLKATVYCRPNPELAELVKESGLHWVEVPYVVKGKGPWRTSRWRNFFRTWRTAVRTPSSAPVLLAPGAVQLATLPILACLLARRVIVCYVPMAHDAATLRMSWPTLRDWLAARLASQVSSWITISAAQARRLSSCWRIRAPVYIVPNRLQLMSGPPASRSSAMDAAARGAPAAEVGATLNVLYLGRFNPVQKGLDWLASVIRNEQAWTAGYTFTFQGRGAYLEPLQALARELGPGRVRVLPWGNTAETLAAADLLILASRFEGLPLVAIEAVWAGVAVVATAESGLEDVLPAQCLFPFGDSSRLRVALERMRSPASREEAVAYAREHLDTLLSEERFRRSVRDVVEGLETLRPSGRPEAAAA